LGFKFFTEYEREFSDFLYGVQMNRMFNLGKVKRFGWCVAALALLPLQSGLLQHC
jgi:hypothetical protein